jgi:hypothetical protein
VARTRRFDRAVRVALVVVAVSLALAAVVRHGRDAGPSPDGRLYLAVAKEVAEGHGPVMPDGSLMTMRAPLYPAMLGAGMAVLGDPLAADVARALVALLMFAAIGAIAWWWYGWAAATLAVLLIAAAAPVLDVLADWYPDGLVVALSLTALLLLDAATLRGSLRVAVFAGLVLAVAVLVKETAGFVAAGPVIASLARVDRDGWGWVRPTGVAALVSSATVTPWLVLHAVVEERFFLTSITGLGAMGVLLGWFLVVATCALVVWPPASVRARLVRVAQRISTPRAAIAAASVTAVTWAGAIAIGLGGGITLQADGTTASAGEILRDRLAPALGMPLLAALGVGVLGVGVARRQRRALVHAGAFSTYVPLMLLWPLNGSLFVARTGLVAVALVHVASAHAVVVVVRRVAHTLRTQTRTTVVRGGVALGATAVVASCAWAGVGAVRTAPIAPLRHGPELQAVSAWLSEHVEPGTPIMGTYLGWTWIARETDAAYPVHLAPWTHLDLTGTSEWFRPVDAVPVVGDPEPYRPDSYGQDWLAVRRHGTKGYLLGLSQTGLLESLRDTGARYLVYTAGELRAPAALLPVLESIDGLQEVERFGDTVVLAVDPHGLEPLADPPLWTDAVTRAWLELEAGRALPASVGGSADSGGL